MPKNQDSCPHCSNKIGLVFGTCLECGFNHIQERFRFIKVDVEDLEPEQEHLIWEHAKNTRGKHAITETNNQGGSDAT